MHEDSLISNLQRRKVSHHIVVGFVSLLGLGGLYFAVTLAPPLRDETDWAKIIIACVSSALILLAGLTLAGMYIPSSASSWNVRAAKIAFGGLGLAAGLSIGAVASFAGLRQGDDLQGCPVYLLILGGFASVFCLAGSLRLLWAGLLGHANTSER